MSTIRAGSKSGLARVAWALLLLTGCSDGGGTTGSQCPSDLPASCPTPAPSYQTDIEPLLKLRCLSCHSAGGVESNLLLDSYSAVYSQRSAVLDQVYGCMMPPAGATSLDATERQQLLSWLVCKAPNN